MKRIKLYAMHMAVALMAAATIVSCSGKSADGADGAKKTDAGKPATTAKTTSAVDTTGIDHPIEIRYVSEEELMNNYNLAKDFKESSIRAYSKLESAQKTRANEIAQLGQQIESKMKSNGYSSESEYNADMARFQKKQSDAETYLGNLQHTTELDINQMQTALQDSIKSFVKDYSAKMGYDVVLMQSASIYINPKLDITNAVVEGLNARYNKVSK